MEYLGCTAKELVDFLTEKMARIGLTMQDDFQIDHIKPVSRFSPAEVSECMNFTNLQVLTPRDNLLKKATWTDADERFWREHIIHNPEFLDTYLPGGMLLPNNTPAIEEDARDNATAI